MTDQKDTTVSTERLADPIEKALTAAREMAGVMEGLTSCRGDDDYVWGVQAKIQAGIDALSRRSTDGEAVAWRVLSDEKPQGAMFARSKEEADHIVHNIEAYVKKGVYTNPRAEPLYASPIPIEPVAVSEEMVERAYREFMADVGHPNTRHALRAALKAALEASP